MLGGGGGGGAKEWSSLHRRGWSEGQQGRPLPANGYCRFVGAGEGAHIQHSAPSPPRVCVPFQKYCPGKTPA